MHSSVLTLNMLHHTTLLSCASHWSPSALIFSWMTNITPCANTIDHPHMSWTAASPALRHSSSFSHQIYLYFRTHLSRSPLHLHISTSICPFSFDSTYDCNISWFLPWEPILSPLGMHNRFLRPCTLLSKFNAPVLWPPCVVCWFSYDGWQQIPIGLFFYECKKLDPLTSCLAWT